MNTAQIQQLEKIGVHYATALARFMDNEALLHRFLFRFPQDPNYSALVCAIQSGNINDAFRAAHTLKGITSMLSMDDLFAVLSEQSERLRTGDLSAAQALQPEVDRLYTLTCQTLQQISQA